MGLFDRFRRPKAVMQSTSIDRPTIVSAVALDNTEEIAHTYDNRNITFSGDLADYDYDSILRDKQNNINSLYELSDYFVDEDPIYRGIIKGVYTAFSVTDWKLIGANEKTKAKYEEYYKRINLRDRMASIFYQYFKYANVYVYLMEDGNIITLPVHKTRISNMMLNGEPILEFDAQSIQTDYFNQGAQSDKGFIDDEDIDEKLRGFPPEVAEGVKKGYQWVQLNPENTFVLQDLKEDWTRYAIPIIATCLSGLAKKKLITNYEDALLNLGINSFVHVRYGDDKASDPTMMPNREELMMVQSVFRGAMKGSGLAVTNNYAKAEIIQADTKDLFEYDKFKVVNQEILAAGGISGIIVSGRAEDGSTFASAQVSINTADKRIELARRNFCELMNKINRKVNGSVLTHSTADKVPEFTLVPVDLGGNGKFQKTCYDLWKDGCMSTETLLQLHGFDFKQEAARKQAEVNDGTYELLNKDLLEKQVENADTQNVPSNTKQNNVEQIDDSDKQKVGRPEIDDSERTSDKGKAMTGKQPKPSNPDASIDENYL